MIDKEDGRFGLTADRAAGPSDPSPCGSRPVGSIPSAEAPICIECASTASLVSGRRIYPHRRDLYDRNFWLCDCGAYCGTHRGTAEPLGYPCGPVTRRARSAAHAAFDPLWRGRGALMGRGDAYRWLAKRLGIDVRDCHIGMMDAAMAEATARFATQRAAQAIEARQGGDSEASSVHESAVHEVDAPDA